MVENFPQAVPQVFSLISDEFTGQLLYFQLKTIPVTHADELADWILTGKHQMYNSQQLPPMEVMNLIEQFFVNFNLRKGLKVNCVVEVITKGRTTTWMKNNQLGHIRELYPHQSGLMTVPREYDTFLYYRIMNRDLLLEWKSCNTITFDDQRCQCFQWNRHCSPLVCSNSGVSLKVHSRVYKKNYYPKLSRCRTTLAALNLNTRLSRLRM